MTKNIVTALQYNTYSWIVSWSDNTMVKVWLCFGEKMLTKKQNKKHVALYVPPATPQGWMLEEKIWKIVTCIVFIVRLCFSPTKLIL